MSLSANVAARLIQLTLNASPFTAREFVAGLTETRFHSIDMRLLARKPRRFTSRELARPYAASYPLTLILLTVVDAAATLCRGIGNGERETHEYSKTDR